MNIEKALENYVLRLADTTMIMGQRLSELCSKGPYLEEDIAISNIALDYLGQANSLYIYASQENKEGKSADDLAFRRDERYFYNLLIVEQENGHFGNTIAKIFCFAAYQEVFYSKLLESNNNQLAAIAEKSLKEVKYHLRHAKSWIIRLGDGTKESKEKVQIAINDIWRFTGEFFEMDEIDKILLKEGVAIDATKLKKQWDIIINDCLNEANLKRPEDSFMMSGGKTGLHSEKLGFILAEMQFLQRAYPDAKW